MVDVEDDRARLTVPDVIYVLMGVAFLAALWPVFSDLLTGHAGDISEGGKWLFLIALPFAILVLFTMVFRKASEGLV